MVIIHCFKTSVDGTSLKKHVSFKNSQHEIEHENISDDSTCRTHYLEYFYSRPRFFQQHVEDPKKRLCNSLFDKSSLSLHHELHSSASIDFYHAKPVSDPPVYHYPVDIPTSLVCNVASTDCVFDALTGEWIDNSVWTRRKMNHDVTDIKNTDPCWVSIVAIQRDDSCVEGWRRISSWYDVPITKTINIMNMIGSEQVYHMIGLWCEYSETVPHVIEWFHDGSVGLRYKLLSKSASETWNVKTMRGGALTTNKHRKKIVVSIPPSKRQQSNKDSTSSSPNLNDEMWFVNELEKCSHTTTPTPPPKSGVKENYVQDIHNGHNLDITQPHAEHAFRVQSSKIYHFVICRIEMNVAPQDEDQVVFCAIKSNKCPNHEQDGISNHDQDGIGLYWLQNVIFLFLILLLFVVFYHHSNSKL